MKLSVVGVLWKLIKDFFLWTTFALFHHGKVFGRNRPVVLGIDFSATSRTDFEVTFTVSVGSPVVAGIFIDS